MTLYLRLGIGDACYLVDAGRVAEIRPGRGDAAKPSWQGTPVEVADIRRWFGVPLEGAGCCILLLQEVGAPVAAIADRAEGLIEFDDDDWRPLPPIGPLGDLLDAIAMPPGSLRPVLRLRGERIGTQMLTTPEINEPRL